MSGNDPMADILGDSGGSQDPYGTSEAYTILNRLLNSAPPEVIADAVETFLQRLALLELYLENEEIDLDAAALKTFRETHLPQLRDATTQLAHLLHGNVARREGG
jgi:hypothetical protein